MFGKKLGDIPDFILTVFLGLLLMVPGVLLLVQEFQKPVEKQQDQIKILSYVLLLLGGMIALGFGRNFFL